MKRWEYKIFPAEKSILLANKSANLFGRDGWEIFQIVNRDYDTLLYMKRELEDK